MTAPATAGIRVATDGAVLTLTIDRPARLNAVTAEVLADLADLVEEVGDDPDVRVVVLAGAGRAFSSGADLGVDARSADSAKPPSVATLLEGNRLMRALRAVPQPTVAVVQGPAVGIGCSIALGCDLVVAAEEAYFLLSFTSIGLMPDGGATALIPAAIGRARAMGMALVPERVDGATAQAWGLIYRAVPAADLAGTVEALVTRLAAGAPRALAATKRAVDAAALAQLEPALERELAGQEPLLATADFAEAVTAFAAKRPPTFNGA